MSLKVIGLGNVLTRRQFISFHSPNFSRTMGSEAIQKWEGKNLFSPPCIEIWTAFALPALQEIYSRQRQTERIILQVLI